MACVVGHVRYAGRWGWLRVVSSGLDRVHDSEGRDRYAARRKTTSFLLTCWHQPDVGSAQTGP